MAVAEPGGQTDGQTGRARAHAPSAASARWFPLSLTCGLPFPIPSTPARAVAARARGACIGNSTLCTHTSGSTSQHQAQRKGSRTEHAAATHHPSQTSPATGRGALDLVESGGVAGVGKCGVGQLRVHSCVVRACCRCLPRLVGSFVTGPCCCAAWVPCGVCGAFGRVTAHARVHFFTWFVSMGGVYECDGPTQPAIRLKEYDSARTPLIARLRCALRLEHRAGPD